MAQRKNTHKQRLPCAKGAVAKRLRDCCSNAEKPARIYFIKLREFVFDIFRNFAEIYPLAQRKNTHRHRLPPGGSWRRRRLKESAKLAFSFFFRFLTEVCSRRFQIQSDHRKSETKNKIRSPPAGKTAAFCRLSVPRAPSVTLARDTFLPERQRLTNCVAAKYPSSQSEAVRLRGSKSAFSKSQHPSVACGDSSPL